MKSKLLVLVLFFSLCTGLLFAGPISFSGGKTSVNLQDGQHSISLSEKAQVTTEDIKLNADSIDLYGDDYNYLKCTGNVKIVEEKKQISLSCPVLVYDRNKEELMSDGWIEIDDLEHEVKLSGAWLDYNKKDSIMTLQIQATILKQTSKDLMTCTADTIEYNSNTQMVTLKGSSKVVWGDDTYKASVITVNLDTEEVVLYGSIAGEVNG